MVGISQLCVRNGYGEACNAKKGRFSTSRSWRHPVLAGLRVWDMLELCGTSIALYFFVEKGDENIWHVRTSTSRLKLLIQCVSLRSNVLNQCRPYTPVAFLSAQADDRQRIWPAPASGDERLFVLLCSAIDPGDQSGLADQRWVVGNSCLHELDIWDVGSTNMTTSNTADDRGRPPSMDLDRVALRRAASGTGATSVMLTSVDCVPKHVSER